MIGRSRWIMRQLRWLLAARKPLARRWDRIEAGIVIAAIIVALAVVPVAMLVGSHVRAQASADAAQQWATRTPATAVLLADAPDNATGEAVAARPEPVAATWRLADGTNRTGTVNATPGASAGTQVAIWVDQAGNAVAAPMTRANVLSLAIGFGALAWAGAAAILCLLVWLARLVLDRARAAAWTREWAQLGRDLHRF